MKMNQTEEVEMNDCLRLNEPAANCNIVEVKNCDIVVIEVSRVFALEMQHKRIDQCMCCRLFVRGMDNKCILAWNWVPYLC